MRRPDSATGLRRRLFLLHIPAVVLATVWVHAVAHLANGFALFAVAMLVSLIVLMVMDVTSQKQGAPA